MSVRRLSRGDTSPTKKLRTDDDTREMVLKQLKRFFDTMLYTEQKYNEFELSQEELDHSLLELGDIFATYIPDVASSVYFDDGYTKWYSGLQYAARQPNQAALNDYMSFLVET